MTIELTRKLKMFKETNTKVFLKIKFNEFRYSKYNGFIKQIKKDYILFNDDLKGEIPIYKKDILKADISNVGGSSDGKTQN